MKNSKITLAVANHTSKFLVQSSVLILALLLFLTSNMQAANGDNARLVNEKLSPAAMVDPYFSNIISKIKMGHFFNATVSTLNEKTRGKDIDIFSSYGFTQDVNKLNDRNLELKNLSTSFSDRSHFSGSKTIESIVITDNGSKVNVEVTFVTWGNTKSVLTDVRLKLINKVTFLTGYVVNGSNATYYTIALKDMGTIN
jgi:hypothetical protein